MGGHCNVNNGISLYKINLTYIISNLYGVQNSTFYILKLPTNHLIDYIRPFKSLLNNYAPILNSNKGQQGSKLEGY